MSSSAMPSATSASVNAADDELTWSIASAPVAALACTPSVTTAVSGSTRTVPVALTVIVPASPADGDGGGRLGRRQVAHDRQRSGMRRALAVAGEGDGADGGRCTAAPRR